MVTGTEQDMEDRGAWIDGGTERYGKQNHGCGATKITEDVFHLENMKPHTTSFIFTNLSFRRQNTLSYQNTKVMFLQNKYRILRQQVTLLLKNRLVYKSPFMLEMYLVNTGPLCRLYKAEQHYLHHVFC